MDGADYTDNLLAHLPPGPAWPRLQGAWPERLHRPLGSAMAEVDARAADLVEEADPRTALELIEDWERVTGLDDAGGLPLAARRLRLAGRAAEVEGLSRAAFIARTAAMGFAITIDEHRPLSCKGRCDTALNPDPWRFVWRVNAPAQSVASLDCRGACDEPLGSWSNAPLEELVLRQKPAETKVLFSYSVSVSLNFTLAANSAAVLLII